MEAKNILGFWKALNDFLALLKPSVEVIKRREERRKRRDKYRYLKSLLKDLSKGRITWQEYKELLEIYQKPEK